MPRPLRAALLALAILPSGCLPAHLRLAPAAAPMPGLRVSVDEAFYRVGGVTAPQLNVELARRGPRRDGVRWQGLTGFRMVYSYEPAVDADGCRVSDPRVSVRVVTTLPRWMDRDDAPAPLRADWDLYLGRLRAHEEGHQRIAIDAGEALLEDVASLEAPTCDALRKSADALAEARLASVEREQEGWDVETDHGLDGEAGF